MSKNDDARPYTCVVECLWCDLRDLVCAVGRACVLCDVWRRDDVFRLVLRKSTLFASKPLIIALQRLINARQPLQRLRFLGSRRSGTRCWRIA